MVAFVVKQYAVRKAKVGRHAVRKGLSLMLKTLADPGRGVPGATHPLTSEDL